MASTSASVGIMTCVCCDVMTYLKMKNAV